MRSAAAPRGAFLVFGEQLRHGQAGVVEAACRSFTSAVMAMSGGTVRNRAGLALVALREPQRDQTVQVLPYPRQR